MLLKRTSALLLLIACTVSSTALVPTQPVVPDKPTGPQEKQMPARGTGYKPLTPQKRAHYQAISRAKHGNHIMMAAKNLDLSSKFDCRDKVSQPIGDQSSCGSCYLYSTIWYQFTCAGIYAGFGKVGTFQLSVQYGMDRPRDFGGCGGGNGIEVADWAVKNGWIAEYWTDADGKKYSDYPPYQASSGGDRTRPGAKKWCQDWTWGFVSHSGQDGRWTIEEFKAAMILYGRINVCLDAGGQFGNGTGTITALGRNINHEISACAYNDDEVNQDGTKGTITLENQWSKQWGVNGYRKITYKAALAGIVDPFWVRAGDPTPDPIPPPVPGVLPPFKLYIGTLPTLTQIGVPAGYATLVGAETDATKFATVNNELVYIYDSAKLAVLVETVKPGIPPGPVPPNGKVVIELTAKQVQDVLTQIGAKVITKDMTLGEILEQLKKNQQKEQEQKEKTSYLDTLIRLSTWNNTRLDREVQWATKP